MSYAYVSIKEDVLKKLEANLLEIRERFGIERIGIFGSVARGDDTPDSDVDILISFKEGQVIFANLVSLGDYLEELFGRSVDVLTEDGISKYMRPYIEPEVIPIEA
ncbi:MAG: nucleotidyltransferase family protein [Methanocorpusculum sp.]|nr:nucleotidyltransferase family protein [Methanocorpusculum sp.]